MWLTSKARLFKILPDEVMVISIFTADSLAWVSTNVCLFTRSEVAALCDLGMCFLGTQNMKES